MISIIPKITRSPLSAGLLLGVYLLSITVGLLSPRAAWALDNGTSGAGSIQTSALEADYGGCEGSCSDVFEAMQAVSGEDTAQKKGGKGSFKFGPANAFTDDDHKECANLCTATNSAVAPNGAHCFEAPTFTKGCSLPDQVLRETGASCDIANKMAKGCKFYSSTLLGQCEVAYRATASNGHQEILLTLDAVAAGSCATACFSKAVGPTFVPVCKGAALLASTAEIIGAIAVGVSGGRSSGQEGRGAGFDWASGLGALGAAGGVVGMTAVSGPAVVGAQQGVDSAVGQWKWGDKAGYKMENGVWKDAGGNALPEDQQKLFNNTLDQQGDAGNFKEADYNKADQKLDEAKEDEGKDESCISMAMYLALGGIRLWSMMDAKSTRKDACEQAESLYSQALAAATAAGGDVVINPNNSVVVNSSDGSLTGTTASGAAMTVTEGVGGDKSTPSVSDVMSGEGFAATAEGQTLGPSGLGQAIAPLASQMDKNAFRKAISGGPAGFTQAALGGVGINAEQAAAANAIVKNAYDNAPKLASRIGGSLYASGGGGGRSGGGSSSSSGGNPFASLMGGKSAGPGTDAMSFGAVQRDPAGKIISSDIWHTGTDKSLFQIVSERVRTVEPRLK